MADNAGMAGILNEYYATVFTREGDGSGVSSMQVVRQRGEGQ